MISSYSSKRTPISPACTIDKRRTYAQGSTSTAIPGAIRKASRFPNTVYARSQTTNHQVYGPARFTNKTAETNMRATYFADPSYLRASPTLRSSQEHQVRQYMIASDLPLTSYTSPSFPNINIASFFSSSTFHSSSPDSSNTF